MLIPTPAITRRRLLRWASEFPQVCWLDNCGSEIDQEGRIEWMLGVGAGSGITSWEEWQASRGSWIMGAIPYEWKSRSDERLQSAISPQIDWPEISGFVPDLLLIKLRNSDRLWVINNGIPGWEEAILAPDQAIIPTSAPDFQSNFSREKYIQTVKRLQQHIEEGDCYEINLAQCFSAEYEHPQPEQLFLDLIDVSPVPFAAYYKTGARHLISASPERFLQHRKGRLLTQPIKGTAPRSSNPMEDQQLIDDLRSSEKEQAENVMIVDLSRHDLNRFCAPWSVQVPRLFDIQSFPQVHQMVSTVEGRLDQQFTSMDALEGIFPPGSMTGAPKFKVMSLIDQYEGIGRGLYAGSVGYVTPSGDFDLNVIIRSLIYDEEASLLNYHVGGAITYDSDPEQEYEETILKAQAIRRIFS